MRNLYSWYTREWQNKKIVIQIAIEKKQNSVEVFHWNYFIIIFFLFYESNTAQIGPMMMRLADWSS